MRVVKAPDKEYGDRRNRLLFLAGSIEMGKATNWQDRVAVYLADVSGTILNPRRDDWDSSWKQSLENPQFVEQVEWEFDGLEDADYVFMYFEPMTQSPITLLELGLMAQHRSYQDSDYSNIIKMLVVCPEGFWRKGDVDVVCRKYDIDQRPSLKAGMEAMKAWLTGGKR